ncbi:hypothetical protein BAUCODRAFT_371843 [Baudoinia panamericana UAMH 10762]|uniref:Uncharacterized protein n=1 Tax=Baudoinia panamericana (strain UAMH 10762) TaxID=717646 RepID=M2NM57_BAUPA|nr:uncharacterized protein BAUCODRAFT_371843 [Baudoinia panamericana UAMH 10762]EMD00261.1 hypothetical protein BAUCODRAFT_371843 [Baudoinia panamericana UAMH 10762]
MPWSCAQRCEVVSLVAVRTEPWDSCIEKLGAIDLVRRSTIEERGIVWHNCSGGPLQVTSQVPLRCGTLQFAVSAKAMHDGRDCRAFNNMRAMLLAAQATVLHRGMAREALWLPPAKSRTVESLAGYCDIGTLQDRER